MKGTATLHDRIVTASASRVDKPDGPPILDAVFDTLTKYVVFPHTHAAVAYTLWIAATYAQSAWEHATRFVFKSPLKRCGKTRAQEIGRELCRNAISTTNISVTALVRSIDETDPPTLFLDEADTVFAKRRGEDGAEDLRGILNSGHSRGWPYIRWDVKSGSTIACPTFAMALLGGIGDLPDTIEDRAVVVSMRRRAPGEPIASFRRRRVLPQLHLLADQLREWVASLDLEDIEPELPVEDRDADKWEPLIGIADAAGGHWPASARAACLAFCEDVQPDDASAAERLLADLATVWVDPDEEFTSDLLERLHRIEEAPWSEWFGKPLTAHGLARLLKPYARSRNVRRNGRQAKGYARADLADAWRRYIPPAVPSVPPSQSPEAAASAWDGDGTDSDSETVPRSEQQERDLWDAGTDGTQGGIGT